MDLLLNRMKEGEEEEQEVVVEEKEEDVVALRQSGLPYCWSLILITFHLS